MYCCCLNVAATADPAACAADILLLRNVDWAGELAWALQETSLTDHRVLTNVSASCLMNAVTI